MENVSSANHTTIINNYNNGPASTPAPAMSPEDALNAIFTAAHAPGGVGTEAAANALGNEFSQFAGDFIKDVVGSRDDVPPALQDKIDSMIDAAVDRGMVETPDEAMDLIQASRDAMEEFFADEMQDFTDSSTGEGNGGGEGDNWLVVLARAMSGHAGKQLGKLIDAQEKLSKLEGAAAGRTQEEREAGGSDLAHEAEQMSKLTGEITARSHMYKMLQTAMDTAIKGIGEALSATLRKQ